MSRPVQFRSTQYLYHVSLSTLEEQGQEISDGGKEFNQFMGAEQYKYLMSCLTNRQRMVAELLFQGYKRYEAAERLEVSIQAIHQIVPRIRKRLRTKLANLESGK